MLPAVTLNARVSLSVLLPPLRKGGGQNVKLHKLILFAILLGSQTNANAWSFYWSKVEVQSSSWQTCMNFAQGAAQQLHLAQVKKSNLDVTGNRNGAFATITCIGTGGNSKAMAVVMV